MKRGRGSVVSPEAFQDLLPHNRCFGCGPHNPNGLHLKSYWSGHELSVATFTPETYHCAGPTHFVNGGVIATLIDCHCVCTAAAAAYRDAGRDIGSEPQLHYATARLETEYLRPTPMGTELRLEAAITARTARTYVISCSLLAAGRICVRGLVEAIAVPASWVHGSRVTE
jgi:acyl-coenzyme A thioesterase PaaI-like protein